VILIHPPVAKPSEPPAGIAKLSGALTGHGVRHTLLDANIEGILHLIQRGSLYSDTWTRRASRNVARNLALLRTPTGYGDFSRYHRAVADTNRLLEKAAGAAFRLSLADYSDLELSPVRSGDLLCAAEHPEGNPFYPYFSTRLRGLFADSNETDLVGISLNYLSQALCTFSIIGFLRREYPGLRIVLGGSLVTSWMSNPSWKDPFTGLVDHLVSGPGERPLLSLLGITAKEEHLSFSYDDLPLGDYLAPGKIIPYAASTGCYWRHCSFCPEKSEGAAFIPNSPAQVAADLKHLVERHEPALLHLIDNALSPSLMAHIVESPIGTPWYGFSRITPALTDVDFCMALRKSGCVMLKVGLESGDQSVLDSLDKGVNLEVASRALAALTQAGVGTYVYLLFGTPQESRRAAERTLEFVAGHRNFIDFLNLAIFNLPIHCAEAEGLNAHSFYEGDLSLYADFVHPVGWNRREVRGFLDREFRKHPAIRPILLRQPPFFTSNHAPFFVRDNHLSSKHRNSL
jgi:hypothetical protein